MTTLLALETSGTLCSVAIFADGEWAENTQNVQRMHNQVLLGQIADLTRVTAVGRRGFDLIAFGAGPGSFTGVRIAAATAQALAFAGSARIVAVPSSRALAETANERGLIAPGSGVVTVTRSRRDAHYLAAFAADGAGAGLSQTLADSLYLGVEPPAGELLHGWIGVGDKPDWWEALPLVTAFFDNCTTTAITVGRLALDIAGRGGAVAPEAGLPIYVTGDSPWKPSSAPARPAGPAPGESI